MYNIIVSWLALTPANSIFLRKNMHLLCVCEELISSTFLICNYVDFFINYSLPKCMSGLFYIFKTLDSCCVCIIDMCW